MNRPKSRRGVGALAIAVLALGASGCHGEPSAPSPPVHAITIRAPALSASGAAAYRAHLTLWFDGLGSSQVASIDLEPGVTDELEFRSPRLAPGRFDSLSVRVFGPSCTLLLRTDRMVIRQLPEGTHPTVEIDLPLADSARLVTGTVWCGSGLDDLFGNGSRYYLQLRFDSVDPDDLRGRFSTGYDVTRRGEEGPFTGRMTAEGFELMLENTDTAYCSGSFARLFGKMGSDNRILGVRIESTDPTCFLPSTSVQLYTAPDYWDF